MADDGELTRDQHGLTALMRLRQAQDRGFDREGVPMFLAIVSAGSQPAPVVADPTVLAEGARLAAELAEVRAALFPTRRDDDLGVLVSCVQALTVGTFDPDQPL